MKNKLNKIGIVALIGTMMLGTIVFASSDTAQTPETNNTVNTCNQQNTCCGQ